MRSLRPLLLPWLLRAVSSAVGIQLASALTTGRAPPPVHLRDEPRVGGAEPALPQLRLPEVEELRVAAQLGADGSAAVALMSAKVEKPKYNNCTVLAPFAVRGKCGRGCPPGHAPDVYGVCAQCPDGEKADHGIRACVKKCPRGKQPVSTCPVGAFCLHGGFVTDCVCPSGRAPNKWNECVPCVGARPFADHALHACVARCPSGQAPDARGDCQPCSEDRGGVLADHHVHKCVPECAPGKAPTREGDCMCAIPGTSPNAENTCVACAGATPFADYGRQKCLAFCPAGKIPGPNGTCTRCEAEKYADHATRKCVTVCPEGRLPHEVSGDCRCPSGSAPDEAGACQNCSATSALVNTVGATPYADPVVHACVAACSPGMAPNARGDCVPCGGVKPFALRHLTFECVSACPAGMAPNADGDCARCIDPTPYADPELQKCVKSCPEGQSATTDGACTCPGGHALGSRSTASTLVVGEERHALAAVAPAAGPGGCVRCNGTAPFVDRATHACVAKCPRGTAPSLLPESKHDCLPCAGTPKPFLDPYTARCVESCPAKYSGTTAARTGECACPEGSVPGEFECEYCRAPARFANLLANACVESCPPGQGPDELRTCTPCSGLTPFADHAKNACVASCAPGLAPDKHGDCMPCEAPTPFADHGLHQCLSVCPGKKEAGVNNDCRCPPRMVADQWNACQPCSGDAPYADHARSLCVERCEPGAVPDAGGDCEACTESAPFADQEKLECVATCPAGSVPNEENDCERTPAPTPVATQAPPDDEAWTTAAPGAKLKAHFDIVIHTDLADH